MPPEDILPVNPAGKEEEEEEEEEEDGLMYPMINGIKITGERIDLQRPTKVLLMRKKVQELHKKIARSGEGDPPPPPSHTHTPW